MDTINMPRFTAEKSLYKEINQYNLVDLQQSPTSQLIPQACSTTCTTRISPLTCLIIPFPFCLLFPQRDCTTLCQV